MICGPDDLSQHIYREVYLSSKGPSDCAVDVEADRQLMAVKLITWYGVFCRQRYKCNCATFITTILCPILHPVDQTNTILYRKKLTFKVLYIISWFQSMYDCFEIRFKSFLSTIKWIVINCFQCYYWNWSLIVFIDESFLGLKNNGASVLGGIKGRQMATKIATNRRTLTKLHKSTCSNSSAFLWSTQQRWTTLSSQFCSVCVGWKCHRRDRNEPCIKNNAEGCVGGGVEIRYWWDMKSDPQGK